MSEKKNSFLNGAFILAVAGLICKVIGAVYKIPLRHFVGADTMGVYSQVYPIYTFLLILSTSGIPTAISKLVAEKRRQNDHSAAHKVFTTSYILLLIIGAITSLIMLFGSGLIAAAMSIESWQPVAAISLSLLFVSLLSAYRGYFQGLLDMMPTAITQLVEQIAKLIAGFFFAILLYKKYGYVMGAAGALLGITISEFVALLVIVWIYQRRKATIMQNVYNDKKINTTFIPALLSIAIPMTIGAAIRPLVDAIDSVMVKRIMMSAWEYPAKQVDTLYGFLKSDCGTLINMPTVFTVALSMTLVPAISSALADKAKGTKEVKSITQTGIKLSVLIGLPCTVGFAVMAKEILLLLYSYMDEKTAFIMSAEEKISITASFLMILAVGFFFLAAVQTTSGILQGLGKAFIPAVTLAIGMAVKIVMNLILIPRIGMIGVPIGTVTCYAISAILDFACVIKYTKVSFRFVDDFLRPLLCSAVMTAALFGLKYLLQGHLIGGIKEKLLTVVVILLAALCYGICLILFKAFDSDDLALMPGGKKIRRILDKLHIQVRESK